MVVGQGHNSADAPWYLILLEKLIVTQMVKNYLLYGTHIFVTILL
jgi:hypothetical protein